jgi:hypothetical protein
MLYQQLMESTAAPSGAEGKWLVTSLEVFMCEQLFPESGGAPEQVDD